MQRLIVISLLGLTCGCVSMQQQARPGDVEHVVIIWLKEPGNADARQQLIERSYEFRNIPGIKSVVAGPMVPSERKTVDSTYDVGVVMTFESEQAMRAYDQHPIHQQAVREVLQPLASKFIVYDFRRE